MQKIRRPHAEPSICHESPILGILSATTIITEFALESSKQSDDIGWRPWLPGFPRSELTKGSHRLRGEAPPRNGEPKISGMGRPHAEACICHESPILGVLSATTIITEFALESRANR